MGRRVRLSPNPSDWLREIGLALGEEGIDPGLVMLEQIVDQRSGVDRRVTRLSLRFPDRRLGFARREGRENRLRVSYDRVLAAYRSKPHAIAMVLLAVAVLNIADLALTLRALELGATELNPIMAALLDVDPLLAALFKATIVIGVVAIMWAMRRYRQVLEASLLLLGGFASLVLYSLGGLVLAA